MRVRSRFRDLWKDPVGSNVIAAMIIAAAGYLYVVIVANTSSLAVLNHPAVKIAIPGLLLMIGLFLWRRVRRPHKTLVFVSAGGTCRDPMAKVITTRLLAERAPRARIRVRAAGLGPLSAREASYGARYVIHEMYGEDLLKDHKPELLTRDLVDEADLVLVMDKSLLLTPGKTLPKHKVFLLKEFFGQQGDVVDPWPDGKDADTIKRYRACADELKAILTEHIDQIVEIFAI